MAAFKVDVYSHHIAVSGYNKLGKDALVEFCKRFAQYGLVRIAPNRYVNQILRVYAATTQDRTEYRFHVHLLNDLIAHLEIKGYPATEVEIVRHAMYEPVKVKFRPLDTPPRDYQEPIIEYMTAEGHSKVITLQTGKGKTYCALSAAVQLGVRTVLVVKGMYVDRWIMDLKGTLGLKAGELMVVRGSAELKTLIELAMAGQLDAKFIVITNKTIYNYLEHYEYFNGIEGAYGCHPRDFYKVLGAGLRLIDEVHQDFHLNYRQDMYTHVPKTISLSATLESDDPFMNRMYQVAFPITLRYAGTVYDKYILVKALMYGLVHPTPLRFLRRGRKSYSHVDFEKSVMKNQQMLTRYLNMINMVVYESYIKQMVPGQKMLIFAATVELCTIIVSDLKKRWHELYIGRYTAEDPYTVFSQCDIVVSTVLSAGTAVDVPGLRITLMTTALNSRQSNEQALGRLRRLKDWPDVTPEFLYFVCEEIGKHMEYHQRKVEAFRGKVIAHQTLRLDAKL